MGTAPLVTVPPERQVRELIRVLTDAKRQRSWDVQYVRSPSHGWHYLHHQRRHAGHHGMVSFPENPVGIVPAPFPADRLERVVTTIQRLKKVTDGLEHDGVGDVQRPLEVLLTGDHQSVTGLAAPLLHPHVRETMSSSLFRVRKGD